jgi:hypothetical protein
MKKKFHGSSNMFTFEIERNFFLRIQNLNLEIYSFEVFLKNCIFSTFFCFIFKKLITSFI